MHTTKPKSGRPLIDERAKLAWTHERPGVDIPALAQHLGISRPAVSSWDRVPAERLDAVSAFTKIPRWRLRPDIFPPDPWNL